MLWSWTKPFKTSIIDTLRDTYERQIALLQEQLADARADAQRHCFRADAAVDRLIRMIGLPAISQAGKQEAVDAAERVRVHAESSMRADLFDDVDFATGNGTFKSREEAALAYE